MLVYNACVGCFLIQGYLLNALVVRCRCTIGLNVALMTLFFSLSITFFLLAGGERHPRVTKVTTLFNADINY